MQSQVSGVGQQCLLPVAEAERSCAAREPRLPTSGKPAETKVVAEAWQSSAPEIPLRTPMRLLPPVKP